MVLAAVVASATTRMIATAGSFYWVIIGTSMGIEGVVCIVVAAETLMYQDRGMLPAGLRCLVDRCVPTGLLEERALAGIELASPRQ